MKQFFNKLNMVLLLKLNDVVIVQFLQPFFFWKPNHQQLRSPFCINYSGNVHIWPQFATLNNGKLNALFYPPDIPTTHLQKRVKVILHIKVSPPVIITDYMVKYPEGVGAMSRGSENNSHGGWVQWLRINANTTLITRLINGSNTNTVRVLSVSKCL